jgi:hypothetical protein
MVMPELSILQKNKQNSLMEGWFYNRSCSLWNEKLPTIRPQYTFTPKKPTFHSIIEKTKSMSFSRMLYTEATTKNEFVTRYYDNGDVINSQLKQKHPFYNIKSGFDYAINDQNSLTISGLWK